MWKTHVFRKALGPRLQQIDPEYVIPEEEVLNLCILLFLDHPFLYLTNPCSPCWQQQDGPEPMTSNREPFHFLPTAPDVLFCKGSPSMKKVIMTIQPDLLQSASKRRQTSASVAPRVLTKKRKMITRRVIKKPAPTSPSPSESNTNQVTYFSESSSFISYTCTLVDCSSISRTQLKTSPMQKAQYNMRWLQLWQRQTRNKLIQSMFLMSTQALTGRLLLNRPTLLLQSR